MTVPALTLNRPRLVFGNGAVNNTGSEARAFGRNIFLVTDKTMEELGLSGKVIKSLTDSGMCVKDFSNVEPNPTEETARKGVEQFNFSSANSIIAVGGGSVMDAAKLVSLLAIRTGKPSDYDIRKVGFLNDTFPPLVCIPTTAGTGSEATSVAVVTVGDDQKEKIAILGHGLMPKVAILDPELTLNCPQKLTAYCGMDALSHAMEAVVATVPNRFADDLALEAIKLIGANLEDAVNDRGNIEARENMLYAAHIAGTAFIHTGVGLVHACSHPLTARHGIPHGLANAILLPHVLQEHIIRKPELSNKYSDMAQNLWKNSLLIIDTPDQLIQAVNSLNEKIGIKPRLRDYGVKEGDISHLVPLALNDVSGFTNPVRLTPELVESVYRAAL